MKKLVKIMAIAMSLALVVFMVSCSSFGKLKRAFEKEDYKYMEDLATAQESVVKKLKGEDGESAITLYGFSKIDGLKTTVVIIVEFKTTDELVSFYKESDTVKGFVKDVSKNDDVKAFYDSLVEAGIANGNCLVFTVNPLSIADVANIVKNA